MSIKRSVKKSYDSANSRFYSDAKFGRFEVVFMSEDTVGINTGTILFHEEEITPDQYESDAKPLNLLAGESDDSLHLTVVEGDYVCLVVEGSPTAAYVHIKAIKFEDLEKETGIVFQLAKIIKSEEEEEEDDLHVEDIFIGDIFILKESNPPFWPTLWKAADEQLYIHMEDGWVHNELMGPADAGSNILKVGNIPKDQSTQIGVKFWVVADESSTGVISDPILNSGLLWPVDAVAPTPPGGSDSAPVDGIRNWRLCEIVVIEEKAQMKVWRTGVIEHAAPRMLENASTGETSRIVKKFDLPSVQWKLRNLRENPSNTGNILIEEDGDFINFSVSTPGTGNTSIMEDKNTNSSVHIIATHNDGSLAGQDVDIEETVTTLTESNGTYTYTNELEATVEFTVNTSEMEDKNSNLLKHTIATHNDGSVGAPDFDIEETVTTLVEATITNGKTWTYTNENNDPVIITVPNATKSFVSPPISGHLIATHSDGAGVDVIINETVTGLSASGSDLLYAKEDGTTDTVPTPIPDGYESYEVSICVGGTPTAVHILALSADLP